jgi:N-acetyl-1-D-myo-inositol-2-amino-2-deoxy-alpha-D-glucopyranoside deacetylase
MSGSDLEGGLLLVHAHPDDEVFSTGGVIAQALADGRRVDLVVCTGGEEGEVHDPDLDPAEATPRLREIREAELRCALAALAAGAARDGLLRLHLLGHRDSGMMGTPPNERPDAFWQADLGAAAEPLVRLVREARPGVVVHYDENGGYGHPDHIQAHRIAVTAVAAAADAHRYPETGLAHRVRSRYQTAFGSGRWLELMAQMRSRGIPLPWGYDETLDAPAAEDGGDEPEDPRPGTVEPPVTTVVDVSPWLAAKRAAMACHRTQRQDFGWAIDLPPDLALEAFGSERFVLVERNGAPPPVGLTETSLFPED